MFRGDLIHRPTRLRCRSGNALGQELLQQNHNRLSDFGLLAFRGRLTLLPDAEGLVGDLGVAPTWLPISCVLLKDAGG